MSTLVNNDILEFVDKFQGITIEQCREMFYNTKYGYDTAKRRLRKMESEGYLKCGIDYLTSCKVYYKIKKPSSHSVIINSIYTRMKSQKAEILFSEREFKVEGAKADYFIIWRYNGKTKMAFFEVDINNRTKYCKYMKCYESKVFQKKYGVFPKLVVIGSSVRRKVGRDIKYEVDEDNYRLERLDYYI